MVQQPLDKYRSVEYDGEVLLFLLFFVHVHTMKPAFSYLELSQASAFRGW